MARKPTRIRTTLAGLLLALTPVAPWALGQDAVTELRRLAEQGNAEAQFELGVRHTIGLRLPQDDTEAVRWFRLAADQGHAEAQVVLAGRYALGRGVLEDEAEAERWFRLAAEQGDPEAQYNLGAMYAYGEGVSKDSVHAHKWFNIAGANGNEQVRTIRDLVENDMTRDEIRRATDLARTCMASNYQDCEP